MSDTVIKVLVSNLKPHPRNEEFFDDIDVDKENYERFKKSIQEDGILTPLLVAGDFTIISGNQRYKACVDLGITEVPVIIQNDLVDEDEKLKKLIATNFGRLKNNPMKQSRVISEYEKLCGIKKGNNQWSGQKVRSSDIAKEFGIDERTLRRLKQLQTLSPELQELIEDGTVKYSTALNVWSKLPNNEQDKLITDIGKDKISELTRKTTEQAIRKFKEEKELLEQSNKKLESKVHELEELKEKEEVKSHEEVVKNSPGNEDSKDEIDIIKSATNILVESLIPNINDTVKEKIESMEDTKKRELQKSIKEAIQRLNQIDGYIGLIL